MLIHLMFHVLMCFVVLNICIFVWYVNTYYDMNQWLVGCWLLFTVLGMSLAGIARWEHKKVNHNLTIAVHTFISHWFRHPFLGKVSNKNM